MGKGWVVFLLALSVLGVGFGYAQDDWLLASGCVCLVCAVGGAIGVVRPIRKKMSLRPVGDRFAVLPERTTREEILTIVIPWGSGVLIAAVLTLHRYLIAHSLNAEAQSLAVAGVFAAVVLLMKLLRRMGSGQARTQPRVYLSTRTPTLDEPFDLSVEWNASTAREPQSCSAVLRSLENVLLHYGRYVHIDRRKKTELAVSFSEFTARVVIPSTDHPASGRAGETMYPYYTWQLEVSPKCTGQARPMRVVFPLTIARYVI